MSEMPPVVSPRPSFFENWQASTEGRPVINAFECPLYSDVFFRSGSQGEVSIGPYKLTNTFADGTTGHVKSVPAPVIVLRANLHYELLELDPSPSKTHMPTHHGGGLSDEVAGLAALAMGVRVKSGPISRMYGSGDVTGRPIAQFGYAAPYLSIPAMNPRLPWASGRYPDPDHNLSQLLLLLSGSTAVDPADQVALIRAARLYQEAIWIAESEPALAWLLLVSALETAADRWDQSSGTIIDRLRDARPVLVKAIEEKCIELLPRVAEQLADTIGATRKFRNFTLAFLPPPPRDRPTKDSQVLWDPDNLKRILNAVYSYRSKALHSGIPFPTPMCDVPMPDPHPWAPSETPRRDVGSGFAGNSWQPKDTPMLLHVFEYITRSALKKWWSSLIPQREKLLRV
jgi:hypothetical protein